MQISRFFNEYSHPLLIMTLMIGVLPGLLLGYVVWGRTRKRMLEAEADAELLREEYRDKKHMVELLSELAADR